MPQRRRSLLTRSFAAGLLLAGLAPAWPLRAEAPLAVALTLRDHRFAPAEIHVPAGRPVVLTVKNEDDVAEEFDSAALKVEKVIAAGTYGTVRLRPLGPGRYPFIGEYHAETALGVVVAE